MSDGWKDQQRERWIELIIYMLRTWQVLYSKPAVPADGSPTATETCTKIASFPSFPWKFPLLSWWRGQLLKCGVWNGEMFPWRWVHVLGNKQRCIFLQVWVAGNGKWAGRKVSPSWMEPELLPERLLLSGSLFGSKLHPPHLQQHLCAA